MKWDWKLIAICAAIALMLVGGYELVQEHDARVKAESVEAAQKQVQADAQKQIDAAKADAAKTAQNLQQQIAALEAQKQQPVTAAQLAAEINAMLPKSAPQVLVVPQQAQPSALSSQPAASSLQPSALSPQQLPNAPGAGLQIPAEALQTLENYKLTCDETTAKLSACQATAADSAAEISGLQTQLKSTAKERDQWKAATKGGTWLHRTVVAAKWIAIGGAVGYVAGRKW